MVLDLRVLNAAAGRRCSFTEPHPPVDTEAGSDAELPFWVSGAQG